jgi:hypothetical protein
MRILKPWETMANAMVMCTDNPTTKHDGYNCRFDSVHVKFVRQSRENPDYIGVKEHGDTRPKDFPINHDDYPNI